MTPFYGDERDNDVVPPFTEEHLSAIDMMNAYECPHKCGFCFNDAKLIECSNDRDTYKCNRCGCTFTESCTFEEDFK